MKSRTTKLFWNLYAELPKDVRKLAIKAYILWSNNPYYPSLHFKKLQGYDAYWSVRINETWRAIGVMHGDTIVWDWIGHHSEYDKIVQS